MLLITSLILSLSTVSANERCYLDPPEGVRTVPRGSVKLGRMVTAFCIDQDRRPYNILEFPCDNDNPIKITDYPVCDKEEEEEEELELKPYRYAPEAEVCTLKLPPDVVVHPNVDVLKVGESVTAFCLNNPGTESVKVTCWANESITENDYPDCIGEEAQVYAGMGEVGRKNGRRRRRRKLKKRTKAPLPLSTPAPMQGRPELVTLLKYNPFQFQAAPDVAAAPVAATEFATQPPPTEFETYFETETAPTGFETYFETETPPTEFETYFETQPPPTEFETETAPTEFETWTATMEGEATTDSINMLNTRGDDTEASDAPDYRTTADYTGFDEGTTEGSAEETAAGTAKGTAEGTADVEMENFYEWAYTVDEMRKKIAGQSPILTPEQRNDPRTVTMPKEWDCMCVKWSYPGSCQPTVESFNTDDRQYEQYRWRHCYPREVCNLNGGVEEGFTSCT